MLPQLSFNSTFESLFTWLYFVKGTTKGNIPFANLVREVKLNNFFIYYILYNFLSTVLLM